MRTIGAVILGLLLLASIAGAFLLVTIDPNDHKALIERWASDALGDTVKIDGPIELTRSLTPTLVVHGLSIAGADETGPAVSVGRAELSVVLTSLLFGPLHLPLIAIDKGELDLPLQGELAAGSGDGEVPRIDQITLSNVTIRYRKSEGDPFEGVIEHASFAPAASATTLDITGTIGTVPLHLSGTTGTVAALFAGGQDWPLEADGTLGEGKLGFSGRLGLQDARLTFTLDAKIDLPASTAEALQIPALPLQASATLQGDAASFTAQGLAATYGSSDLQGDLTWRQGARAKLSGKVTAKRIALAELLPVDGGASGGDVVPNPPMLTPALMPMDLDVAASVGRLDLTPGQAATELTITTSGTERELELTLAQAKLGAGQVQAHYQVQADGSSPGITLKLGAQGLDLTTLFGDPGGGNKLPQDVKVALDLTGRGTDLHGFLGSANGPVAISTGAAVIDETFVNMLGKSLFTAILPDFEVSKGAHILCSVLDFEAKDGKARSTAFVIDGKHVVIGGGGAIELASGKIDFVLLPTAKDATLAPLVAPVHLAGTIIDPQVMGDATDILKSTGHLLLGIVNPLSLATPILHPGRSGDMPCRDPAGFAAGQQGPVERVGAGAVDAIEGVGRGIGSALEGLGEGASELFDGITGR